MTNKKSGKYNAMVGDPDVQTEKTKDHGYFTESTNLV